MANTDSAEPLDGNTATPRPVGPVARADRLVQLDVMRGLALFGILLINARQMFQPFFFSNTDYANAPVGVIPGEVGALSNWFVLNTLFDMKFITLFSLLFGIGFALQFGRSRSRDTGFAGTYMRRLLVLGLFGALHAALFYPADILVTYAVCGALFFAIARNWGPALLFQVGTLLFCATVVLNIALTGAAISVPGLVGPIILMVACAVLTALIKLPIWVRSLAVLAILVAALGWQVTAQSAGPAEMANETTLIETQRTAHAVSEAFTSGQHVFSDTNMSLPLDPRSLESARNTENLDDIQLNIIEQSIMRSGPVGAHVTRGLMTVAAVQLYGVLYLYWRTLALFAIGAALMKWGLLARQSRLAQPAMWFGLGLGIPVAVAASWLHYVTLTGTAPFATASVPLHDLSSLLIALGLIGLVLTVIRSSSLRGPAAVLASLGRMALTNYIAQSAALALLTTSFGLGLAGQLTRWEQTIACLAIFAGLAVLSRLWLLVFEYGPLEWVWRSLTYLRPARLMKTPAGGE